MTIDTTKMKLSGQEIIHLCDLINNEISKYYQLVRNINNQAWVGPTADKYISDTLKDRNNVFQLIKCLKEEGELLINISEKVESKINSLKR